MEGFRMKQASFADFAESSGTDLFGFEDYGPTSRRPTPEAELATLFESGGEMVDRREIPDSGLSLSDITDWPYINREESDPDEREHFEEIMSTIDDPRDDSTEAESTDTARSTTRAVADGGEIVDDPATEPEPGDEVLLIENPAVGLNTSPSIVSGEVSSSGKSVMIPEDEGLSNKRRRLDAREIFAGESEYRDSTSWELYTPGRYRSTQSSNYAPGPQAGSNGKSDIGALPEPTHWPDTDEPADAPDVCPACGEREAPWRDVGKARCERCGETVDPDADDESDDSGPDKWDLSTLDRGDCLILEGHRGEFVVTGINYFQGTHTVSTVDVARRDGSEWNEYTLQKVTRAGDERLKVNTDGQPSVAINVDDPGHAQDFEVIGNDEEKLRRYIREGYYGE